MSVLNGKSIFKKEAIFILFTLRISLIIYETTKNQWQLFRVLEVSLQVLLAFWTDCGMFILDKACYYINFS